MNRNVGMAGAAINLCSVVGFALCLITGARIGNYLFGMFIAFGFVPMICAFAADSRDQNKSAAYAAMIFTGMYVVLILLVYFAQATTVRHEPLSLQQAQIISSQRFGLFFNYDLLGYGLMALSTFFAGLALDIGSNRDKWLKRLLLIHGVFFISCLILPLLGLFNADIEQSNRIGPMIQMVWCAYFSVVGVLSLLHFMKKC